MELKANVTNLEYKSFELEAKATDDTGSFTGLASPYNNVDLANDRIMPTIGTRNNGKTVPILYQHDTKCVIGKQVLTATPQGIQTNGKLILDKGSDGNYMIPKAAEAYALLKQGLLKLSIGYNTIKSTYVIEKKENIRNLDDISIEEVSLVTFPCNTQAVVSNVKSKNDKKVEIKIDNSKNSASSTVKWGDLDETPIKQAIQKASNSQALADEACLTLDKDWETNVSKMNYLHHILKDGVLVVDNIGVQAARQRAAQQSIISGTVETHLKKHYKELGLKWDSKKEGENTLETKDQNNLEGKAMGFADLLKVQQANNMRWKLQDALNTSFRQLMNDDTMTADDKVTQLETNVDDFATAYKQAMSLLLKASAKNKTAKKQVADELEKKSLELETKTGKKISKVNKKKIQNCKDILDDLIASLEDNPDEDPEDDVEDDEDKSKKTPKVVKKPANDTQNNTNGQEKGINDTLELKSADNIKILEDISKLFKGDEE